MRYVTVFLLLALSAGVSPTTRPENPIADWFNQLGAAKPLAREQARQRLMDMDPAGLKELKNIVESRRPLRPGQAAVLQEIVTHVHLKGREYEKADPVQGFLGANLSAEPMELEGDKPDEPGRVGIVVAGRLPGFCAYSALCDGDIILSIAEQPVRLDQRKVLVDAIAGFAPGKAIHLQVMRQGCIINVPITLDARPAGLDDAIQAQQFMESRQDEAEKYWRENFTDVADEL